MKTIHDAKVQDSYFTIRGYNTQGGSLHFYESSPACVPVTLSLTLFECSRLCTTLKQFSGSNTNITSVVIFGSWEM